METVKKAVLVESSLLKALAIRQNYETYINYVVLERLLPETKTLVEAYAEYYKLYSEHQEIQFDVFLTQFCSNWHSKDMHDEDIEWYKQVIEKVQANNEVDTETALLGLINKQFIDEVNKIAEKPFNGENIRKALETYENKYSAVIQDCDKDCFKLEDINLWDANPEEGIPYAYEELQRCLLGQVKGDLIIVNAGHGVGKTAFITPQMVHTFLYLNSIKSDRPILFFNSEGSPAQVFGRFLSCLYKDKIPGGYRDVLKSQDKIYKHFFTKYNAKLFNLFRANGKGIGFIRAKIKKYNPSVVFIDMLKGAAAAPSRNESETANLETFAQHLRDLSSSTCPIWATVQAGDSCKYWDAESQTMKHKRWVDSRDIYGSKTGIQGAASTIISIGCDDPRQPLRYIQTTKIKAEDNAQFRAEIQFKYSNYQEL